MKQVIIIFSIILATGCAKDRFEPNNSLKDARPVELDIPFRINIYPAKDVDFFKVKVPEPGYLEFSAGIEKPANMKLEVKFYDEDGNISKKKIGMPMRFSVGKGDVLFSINAEDSKVSSRVLFPVTLSFKEVRLDSYESNDDIASAKPVELGAMASISIFPDGDIDFFKVVTKDTGYLKLGYDINKPANLNLIAAVYDEKSRLLIQDTELPQRFALKRGMYIVGIRNVYEKDVSEQIFNINFEFENVPLDVFEPNDAIETARKIKPNSKLRVSIFPLGDEDYFRIHLPSAGTLRIEAGADLPAQMSIVCRIFNREGRELRGFTKLPASYNIEREGDYFISINEEYNDRADEKSFSLYLKYLLR